MRCMPVTYGLHMVSVLAFGSWVVWRSVGGESDNSVSESVIGRHSDYEPEEEKLSVSGGMAVRTPFKLEVVLVGATISDLHSLGTMLERTCQVHCETPLSVYRIMKCKTCPAIETLVTDVTLNSRPR